MRWSGQELGVEQNDALPGLAKLNNLVRSVQTPEFAGVTFHEILAKSALNHVPGQSMMPFGWTINPYRGCTHACAYCFARPTHTYLDLDAGDDFDRQIIVKVNVGEVLQKELAKPSWRHEPVALGTYPGAVVIASHDRWLRRRWQEEQLELDRGRAVSELEPARRSA